MRWYKSLSFTQKMLLAMIAGAVIGIALGSMEAFKDWVEVYLSNGLFDIIGKLKKIHYHRGPDEIKELHKSKFSILFRRLASFSDSIFISNIFFFIW